LSDDNPTVARLLHDITSLGRIMSSMQCVWGFKLVRAEIVGQKDRECSTLFQALYSTIHVTLSSVRVFMFAYF
jgi:hypothetical protein